MPSKYLKRAMKRKKLRNNHGAVRKRKYIREWIQDDEFIDKCVKRGFIERLQEERKEYGLPPLNIREDDAYMHARQTVKQ